MKKLLTFLLLLLLPTPALANPSLEDAVERGYNVRYAAVTDATLSNDRYVAYVIWYDADEWQESSRRLCDDHGDLILVKSASLGTYVKSQRNIYDAMIEESRNYHCE
ncbi:hypothetical protein [Rhizobium sp. EC-SD404]|uniref:hypothetical protein n=1 Tax=Rhizobium sp. EC-SD404 TaxID=2038389 RepID=UPI0012543233|nr:hypothetical protein [Rhizobium sp. EC-SD404]VVT32936.1 exported hypothetical protein [Rhizobium sp. EC-SD404]